MALKDNRQRSQHDQTWPPSDEVRLPGGNVGGAVRVGDTVRRATGPWTPAVHALLAHLADRLPHVPRVLGFDEEGREVLSFLPGRVIDLDAEVLSRAQLVDLVRWTRLFHAAVADFAHPGPWRYFPIPSATIIGHNDIAPYNACFDGQRLSGVFDWDLSGPSTPLLELAFIAWNGVPLWTDELDPVESAERLQLIAAAYGSFGPRQILQAVPARIKIMLDGIPVAAAAGDSGMVNLMAVGEPERSRATLARLIDRIPAIDVELARSQNSPWQDGR
jgi:hypothetical protein